MCGAVRQDVYDGPVPRDPTVEQEFVTGMSDE
jgi:hypothetical protein